MEFVGWRGNSEERGVVPMNASIALNNPRIVMSGYWGILYITTRRTAKTIVKVPALKMIPILTFSPREMRRFQRSLIGITITGFR